MVSKEFGTADGDHGGTLDKDESFKAADRDNDGTLDAKELGAARGRALLRLLRLGGTCVYLIMPASNTACVQAFLDVLPTSLPGSTCFAVSPTAK